MGLATEFKEFTMKGNVVDMAVGVIVGAAFGKIVSSMVADVITPFLGKFIGDVDFSKLAVRLGNNPTGAPVLVKYGVFLQSIFDFLIIAFVLFLALRGLNRLKTPTVAIAAAPPRQEVLLEEIRDALVKR